MMTTRAWELVGGRSTYRWFDPHNPDMNFPPCQDRNTIVQAAFWKNVSYVQGTYDTPEGFIALNKRIEEIEKEHGGEKRWEKR